MILRAATTGDVLTIADIHSASWRRHYRHALSAQYLNERVPEERRELWARRLLQPAPNQYVVLAEDEAETLGFACVYVGENAQWGAYLDNLHVRSDYQGQGVGKALLRAVFRECYRQAPGQGLCLLVNQDNRRAQRFYLAQGARLARSGVWNAPDGSQVPTFWFVWHSTWGNLRSSQTDR